MNLFRKFIRYMNPSIDAKVLQDMDRQSLRNIHIISLLVLIFETATCVPFLSAHINGFDHEAIVSMISVLYCIVLCALAAVLSLKLMQSKKLRHSWYLVFKIFFFAAFTVWAIFADYRHYKLDDQMLTFFTVDLVMICFVLFRPWLGSILIACAFAGLYIPLYIFDGAAGIQPINFVMLELASIASNAVLYHHQINVSSKAVRLTENNAALETASRRDGLTGLLNRLALEDDAEKMDGRNLTAYMIDINYFKEINDQCGHAAGDAILREVSEKLKNLYPNGHYYRYGGDEFLVLTHKPAEENYGSDSYEFRQEKYDVRVVLSIGNSQGSPESYQELFSLISEADKALYVTKQRTHSFEYGGHDRRKAREE